MRLAIARALVGVGLALTLLETGCTTARELREQKFVSPVEVLQVRWRRKMVDEPLIEYKPQEFAVATSSDDGQRVFVGSSAAEFYALDARTGDIVWKRAVEGGVAGQPRYVQADDTVYLGTMGGVLYAIEGATGKNRWTYRIKGPIESQPTVDNGLVYFTSGENRVYAVDTVKGTWKWQYDREAPESFTIRGYGAPTVIAGRLYVGFSDGYLASLNAATGEVNWARSLAGEQTRFVDVDATPVLYQGTLYVSSFAGGVFALDPKDGSVRWRYEVEGAGSVRAHRGKVYFAAARHGLHCLDTDGHLEWRQALAKGGELSPPVAVGDYVMVSSARGGTYVADAKSGRLYQFFAPGHGVTAAPSTDGRQVYVLSNGGYFYALALVGRG